PSLKAAFLPHVLPIKLPDATLAGIEAVLLSQQASQEALLLACWTMLLKRLTLQETLVLGVAADGRNYEGLHQALGIFEKYLPLRCTVEDRCRLTTLLPSLTRALSENAAQQETFTWREPARQADTSPAAHYFPLCFEYTQGRSKFAAGST